MRMNEWMEDKIDRSVKSSERTLLLFELFATRQRPLTITEICDHLNMPQSSTSMLVSTLVRLGYLKKDSRERTYYPTFRVALLGTWMRRRHENTGRLPKLVSKLAADTGETVVLAMRNGMFAQYVFVQIGPDPLRLHVESGMQRPLACCAVGWALLSVESDREIEKIMRRTQVEARKERWRGSARHALEKVAQFREHHFAMSDGHITDGAGSISTLLPTDIDGSTIAIAVGGPIERIKSNQRAILKSLSRLSQSSETVDARSLVKDLAVAN